jgi:hypothetical protein
MAINELELANNHFKRRKPRKKKKLWSRFYETVWAAFLKKILVRGQFLITPLGAKIDPQGKPRGEFIP